MRNRRRGARPFALSLDSLLDIVANAMGMLVLVALFGLTNASSVAFSARAGDAPLVRHTAKRPVLFECRDNQVFPIDTRLHESALYYRRTFVPHVEYAVPTGRSGDEVRRLRDPTSAFQRAIAELDPATQYAVFMVRPDSFAAYRVARTIAEDRGVEVGWEPKEIGEVLGFSVFGRALDGPQ